jgi:hypothetical protein
MKLFLKSLVTAALFTLGAGAGASRADEHEVNNIWWDVQDNYNGGDQTACVAENYNDHPVDAIFDLFPTSFDLNGNPMPGRAVLTMRPYVTYKLYAWPGGSTDKHCALRSYTVHMP